MSRPPASFSSRVDPRTRHTTPPCPLSKIAVVLSNMRHVTSLTLPSFEITLLRHSVFRLHHLTFLNHPLSQEDYVELLSWLSHQPDLQSLSLPNLVDDNAPVPNGNAQQTSHSFPCTPSPSLVSIPDQTSLSSVFSPFESPDSSTSATVSHEIDRNHGHGHASRPGAMSDSRRHDHQLYAVHRPAAVCAHELAQQRRIHGPTFW
jgi:hypothetical protein